MLRYYAQITLNFRVLEREIAIVFTLIALLRFTITQSVICNQVLRSSIITSSHITICVYTIFSTPACSLSNRVNQGDRLTHHICGHGLFHHGFVVPLSSLTSRFSFFTFVHPYRRSSLTMPIDINLLRSYRGGNPELVRESQRRRFASVELVDQVRKLDDDTYT